MAKKIILIVFCVGAWTLFGWGVYRYQQNKEAENNSAICEEVASPSSSSPLKLMPLNVDEMAARLKKNQDLYQKLRDQSLSAFAKLHPKMDINDTEVGTAIRLATYQKIWGDYYEEDLIPELDRYAKAVQRKCPDPLMKALIQGFFYKQMMSSTDDFQDNLIRDLNALEKSDYPTCFKFYLTRTLLIDILVVKSHPQYRDVMPRSQALLPSVQEKLSHFYAQMIQEKYPDDVLNSYGRDLLDHVQNDLDALNRFDEVLQNAFPTDQPNSALKIGLQGSYYINAAWNARGCGWAREVTEEGWKLFHERLQKAADILEAGYVKYPEAAPISIAMMTVELGQGHGGGRFDRWYQRAIEADPDNIETYLSKQHYLLPRWHGSDREGFNYGLACAETQNWQCKIPLVLTYVLDDIAQRNPKIYADPEIWKQAQYLYHTYLEKYPLSNYQRSRYAKAAAQGEHWELAQEQFQKLGNAWSRSAFPKNEYDQLRKIVQEHCSQPGTTSAP